jgi:hypothetical protein
MKSTQFDSFEPQPLVFNECVFEKEKPSQIVYRILAENFRLTNYDQYCVNPDLICVSVSLDRYLERNMSNLLPGYSLKEELISGLSGMRSSKITWSVKKLLPPSTLILLDTEIVSCKNVDIVDFIVSREVSYSFCDYAMVALKFVDQAGELTEEHPRQFTV